jgi:glyoxylase-like metal-dependent hydrolase (beta-lactamase superfamily II)
MLLAHNAVGGTEPPDLKKLAEGVYAHVVSPDSPFVSNSGVVLLKEAVLVFDTHFTPEGGEGLLKLIREVTSRPIRYIALSHFHPDHTHGTQAFASDALIFASTNTRRDMLEKDLPSVNLALSLARSQIGQMRKDLDRSPGAAQKSLLRAQMESRQKLVERMARLQIRIPNATIDESLTIPDETRTLQFRLLGAGHTDGDAVLYLPQEKIVFAGDLFFNAALPSTEDSHLLEWTATLSELLKLEADIFVPGHGPVAGRKEAEEFLQYLKDLRALVEPAVQQGEPLDQVIRNSRIAAKYAAYSFQNFFPANVKKMYAELIAQQLASPPPTAPGAKKRPPKELPQP